MTWHKIDTEMVLNVDDVPSERIVHIILHILLIFVLNAIFQLQYANAFSSTCQLLITFWLSKYVLVCTMHITIYGRLSAQMCQDTGSCYHHRLQRRKICKTQPFCRALSSTSGGISIITDGIICCASMHDVKEVYMKVEVNYYQCNIWYWMSF